MAAKGGLRAETVSSSRYGSTTRYRQYYRGIPVIGGSVVVRLTAEGSPRLVAGSVARWIKDAEPVYNISREKAINIACRHISPASLRGDIYTYRAVLPRGGRPRFIWRVDIAARDPLGDWEVFIDGADGGIIQVENRLCYLNGSGLVFDPDPVTATGDTTLEDDDDAARAVPGEAYSEVDLPDISMEDDRYVLTGPWADTSPTDNRARIAEADFSFDREDDRFEEVMAYYHIDRQARYVRSLGFDELPPSPQRFDVNGIEEDMSFFSPHTGIITTGSGGVDDAEDADILLHEYGHALMQRILADRRGGDTGLLAEGWCDYLAGDWSLAVNPDFQPFILFNWDGHNEFWAGRVLDSDLAYPEAVELESHEGGQMWSSLLTEIRLAAESRDIWNSVVIDHLYSLTDSATVPEAAAALLESDLRIADGVFRQLIVDCCEAREIIPPGMFSPRMSHQPLGDTENVNLSRRARVFIHSRLPLNPDELWLVYRLNDGAPDSLPLRSVRERGDLFQAFLPAPRLPSDLHYYFTAADTCGVFSTQPAGAPFETYSFHAGPDLVPPLIVEVDSLPESIFLDGEIVAGAVVTDNITVGTVSLIWYWGRMEPGGIVTLQPAQWDSSLYTGRLHWSVEEYGEIHYMITAVDASAAGNTTSSRVSSFALHSEALVDDFERDDRRWIPRDWRRVSGAAALGEYCYADRCDSLAFMPPREAVAEVDENWDFSRFERARLRFWEIHDLDADEGEFGVVEAREIDGDGWLELAHFTGSQGWWRQRTIDLSEYCAGRSAPVRVRFRTHTPQGAEYSGGWRIDRLTLQTDNLVDADAAYEVRPGAGFISSLRPNPTNNRIILSYRMSKSGCLDLLDISGRKVLNLPLPRGSRDISLNLDGLPTGTYMLRLTSDGTTTTQRVVVLK